MTATQQRLYAVGDVHGQLEMLRRAHALIEADRRRCGDPDAPVVHLGDYTDRGPDSRGVVQFLIDGLNAGERWVALKGNHDRMFQWFLEDPYRADPGLRPDLDWLDPRLGGVDTLASYGVAESNDIDAMHATALERVPTSHRRFLENLPLMHVTRDLIFVHAGIRPNVPLKEQAEGDLIWIRKGFLDDDTDHGRLVVHGHTALDAPEHFGNRIDLDGGAGYGRPLLPAVFEGRTCWILTPEGRVRLDPPV